MTNDLPVTAPEQPQSSAVVPSINTLGAVAVLSRATMITRAEFDLLACGWATPGMIVEMKERAK